MHGSQYQLNGTAGRKVHHPLVIAWNGFRPLNLKTVGKLNVTERVRDDLNGSFMTGRMAQKPIYWYTLSMYVCVSVCSG